MSNKRKAATESPQVRPHKVARHGDPKHDTTNADQTCRLLALPAELRNAIYEYTLTAQGNIPISPDLKQPALTMTCRQVRRETLEMHYTLNRFTASVIDCDAALIKAFCRHMDQVERQLKKARGSVSFKVMLAARGKSNWSNLSAWCRDIWDGMSLAMVHTDNMSDTKTVIAAAHDIAVAHLGRKWTECERTLANLRLVAGRLGAEWMD